MRLHTIAAALLVATVSSAQTTGLPTAECYDCVSSIEKPVQKCIKMGFSIGFDFADKVSTLPDDEKKCVCAEVSSSKWVNACRSICPVAVTDSLYKKFETAKPQCAGVSAQPTSPNSATDSMVPRAGTVLAIAAAVAHTFF